MAGTEGIFIVASLITIFTKYTPQKKNKMIQSEKIFHRFRLYFSSSFWILLPLSSFAQNALKDIVEKTKQCTRCFISDQIFFLFFSPLRK